MSGKIILNLAMSLDGYIADINGGYDWIVGSGAGVLNTAQTYQHSKFLKNIDIVVMGKTCYDNGFAKDYVSKTIYVLTHEKKKDIDNIHFISGDVISDLEKRREEGKNIYLFGGGKAVDVFIKSNVIDEYIIGTIPIILGSGIPLFLDDNPTINLHLDKCFIEDGIIVGFYSKRK